MSPKSRAGASKDEPQSSKKPASSGTDESAGSKKRTPAAKAGAAAGKARGGAAKGEPDGAQAGETGTQADTSDAAEASSQAGGRIRTLDFSQPTKFTTEIRRRISSAIEQFCEALSGRLTNELSVEVELSVAEVDQHTWAAAKARLAADAVAVAVEAKAIERQMLLSVEQPLLLQALECLLGGQAAQAPSERHLTDIDWVLARGLLDGIVADLSSSWNELGGPQLTRGEVDLEADAGVFAPVGEPTFAVTLASRIDGQSATMSLLIPWAAVEPVSESIRGGGGPPLTGDVRDPDALRRGLARAQILLRAEVGSAQMPIEQMLGLVPGTLAELQGRADDGVWLFAEGVLLGRGKPGRSGTRRAIKLHSISDTPTRADTYAKLGRAELERARAHVDGTGESAEGRAILRSIFVRVWAELGRTHLPLRDAVELAPGAVVELDQAAEAPVELFVNGLCFANGTLVVTSDGGWGVQVSALV
ncbi:MAG TPA: FliM/FliN family flagellar motor switch protein [Solirubrobacteraceae bacterium]|nr:FliM/FliN family flagellar motor switch protein [Solirubrobacteraceae bacterium]